MIKKILINKDGRKFYVSNLDKDFHTQFGFINKKNLKKKKGIVKTNTKKEFFIFDAGFSDRFRKIKRGAQIITLKDAGSIIAETGINKTSKVLDAGGGSGALSCVLANIAKQIITYEINKNFIKIIKENIKNLDLKNIVVKNKDITKGISDKNLDLIVLDLLNPEKVINHAAKALKSGGFLVVYLPSITQVVSFVKKINKSKNFILIKIIENIQREWKIENKIARPEFRMLGHTGFLTFVRRV
ncbi:methyltransferase domain-containing protein [Candidatus Woesearchaeota archaeon]|nr:methyltransferase domain-containing protein [Candidatus Woesearchaeota archaeon]